MYSSGREKKKKFIYNRIFHQNHPDATDLFHETHLGDPRRLGHLIQQLQHVVLLDLGAEAQRRAGVLLDVVDQLDVVLQYGSSSPMWWPT